jgi:hypothetical protein
MRIDSRFRPSPQGRASNLLRQAACSTVAGRVPEEALVSELELGLSAALGVGLAAAAGFRLFLPMLVMSVAANLGYLPLGEGFAWIGTPAAMTAFAVAALAEIAAYYVPVVDNLLDGLATPAAFLAGTLVSAAVMVDLPPLVKWTAAIVAGGGVAGLTQGLTAAARANSTVLTGGFGNAAVATAEIVGALVVSLLALAAPVLAILLVALFLWFSFRLIRRALARRSPPPDAPAA